MFSDLKKIVHQVNCNQLSIGWQQNQCDILQGLNQGHARQADY